MFSADNKGGMGGSAEKRTRRKRAEAAGEARQRGETCPGKLKTKRNISSSTLFHFFFFLTGQPQGSTDPTKCFICKMCYLLFMWIFYNLIILD